MKKNPRIVTPVGTVMWAAVDKPFTRKGSGDKPAYSIKILLSKADGDELNKKIAPLVDQAKAQLAKAASEAKNPKERKAIEASEQTCVLTPYVDDDGDETGEWVLSCKQNAEIARKDGTVSNATIGVFDAANQPMHDAKVGKGSRVRVSFDPNPYFSPGLKKYGVSGYLVGVKVLEFIPYGGGGSATAAGFEVEDGYVAKTEEETPFSESEEAASAGRSDF
jgi:hypothetical protein